MIGKYFLLIAGLLCTGLGKAEETPPRPRLTRAGIDQARAILRDPTQGRRGRPALNRHPATGSGSKASKLTDPTRLSGNFREALKQMNVKTTTTQLNTTEKLPPFPNISLAAIVYSEDGQGYSMLHIDDRSVLVRVGDKASFVDKGKVVEVVVQEINRNDVRLAVFPAQEIIILR